MLSPQPWIPRLPGDELRGELDVIETVTGGDEPRVRTVIRAGRQRCSVVWSEMLYGSCFAPDATIGSHVAIRYDGVGFDVNVHVSRSCE
jgi:hypothetical protein